MCRATTRGRFIAPPAKAEEMYEPVRMNAVPARVLVVPGCWLTEGEDAEARGVWWNCSSRDCVHLFLLFLHVLVGELWTLGE